MKDLTKKALAEKLWLLYFNQYLFEKGVISEQDRNRMKIQIESRKPIPASKQENKGEPEN